MTKLIAKSFQSRLEPPDSRLKWVTVRIPFDVEKIWGTRGRIKVKGEINAFPFRTSLFPTKTGRHFLLVNKRMQAGANVRPGLAAKFRLEPDTLERLVAFPAELKRAFAGDRALRRWFDQLNYSSRKWLTDRINDVKSAEARTRRAEQLAELLLATMEAELELPPILRVAFAQDTRAREGWERMSLLQRRGHLLAIFYCQSPDARARRVSKMLQNAIDLAEKRTNKKS